MTNGWDNKPLAEVSSLNYGYTESASSEPIGPRFLRITDIQDDRVDWHTVPYCKIDEGEIAKYRLATGDIVFARTGATTGKSFLIEGPPDAVFASYLIRLRLLDKGLSPRFVSLFFQSDDYWETVKAGSAGSAQGGFNASKLGALRIPIPPLGEQWRIVGILDEAFAGIATAKANAEKNLRNARALFASLLATSLVNDKQRWPFRTLDEMVTDDCTLSYGIVQPGEEEEDGLPIVRPVDLIARIIGLDGLKRIDPKRASTYRRTTLQGGELLLCVRGSTGAMAVAADDLKGANVTRGIVPIRFKRSLLDPEFGYYLFRSEHVQDQIAAGTYGAALMQINIRDLRKLKVAVPELPEQANLVATLSDADANCERLASLYQKKLTTLEALKKSLLHQAFSGQLGNISMGAGRELVES